jgi:two-component system OmpR family sensor kinase
MSLSQRLALALIGLLAAMAVALVLGGRYATERYFQEVNQELNGSIAMYVVDRLDLLDESGGVNHEQLTTLADQAMTVNPSVEVYLLDPQGEILAHALPPETVLRSKVSLAPLRQFMGANARLPILGDDPRSTEGVKAFSVHPIVRGDERLGYLYVVLGGKHFDSVLAMFSGSYVWRLTSLVMFATLAMALLLGLWLVFRYTRPLSELQDAVRRVGQAGFAEPRQGALDTVHPQTREVASLKTDIEGLIDKLGEQYTALDSADRSRRELVANVSHDLRTPLASIQGYLETLLLKDAVLTADERLEFLHVAHRHSRRLSHLVTELFELAQLDSGSVKLQAENFSLTELLQDVVHEFELQARERSITLRLDGTDVQVHADIGLIQRVLENLVFNALRFTPDNGEICLKLEQRADQVEVAVIDNGCGIAAADLAQIFDRHYQVSSAADAAIDSAVEADGSGLGLAIVKRILELHNSNIEVQSELAKGTTFSFALAAA